MGDQRSNCLTWKQKNCAQKNMLLKKTSQRASVSLQSERDLLERRMNVEAKNMRKKLTLHLPWSKLNDKSPKAEAPEENNSNKLKLPEIEIRAGSSSAPSSPTTKRRSTTFSWGSVNNIKTSPTSLSPPLAVNALTMRRGSCTDLERLQMPPLQMRRESRFICMRTERRATLGPITPGDDRVSPTTLMPRNLKLRSEARRGSVFKDLEPDAPLSPSLEQQFQDLGSCRYLRRSIGGDDDAISDDKELEET